KLVPACFQPVEDKMFVNTLAGTDGGRVRRAVKVLLELLAADHLPKVVRSVPERTAAELTPKPGEDSAPPSEFARLLAELNRTVSKVDETAKARGSWLDADRFPPREPCHLPAANTSPLFHVDPKACILCNRCF